MRELMDEIIEKTLSSLRYRHLNGVFVENAEEAESQVLNLIPIDAVVGIGDSTTVRQIGVKEKLKERGTRLLDGFDHRAIYNLDAWKKMIEDSTICNIFLTGTNVITQDGRLVNVDDLGNRVAGMFWGHPKTIIAVGKNKIAKDLDEAFYRLRNIIAPNHLRIRTVELGGRKRNTPCVVTGKCNDCRAEDRGCNVFSIIEGKPMRTEINVIIVNEDLGLSWDESWPKERINKIIQNYKKFAWIPFTDITKW